MMIPGYMHTHLHFIQPAQFTQLFDLMMDFDSLSKTRL